MALNIGFFSFADIDNFGDILFSHIFKMEIEKRLSNVEIDFYTPSNFSVEGIDYIAYTKNKIIEKDYDALIVFGGEVIHLFDERTWMPIYTNSKKVIESRFPSDVIYDWVDLNKPFKAWVSVGVRPFEKEEDYLKTISTIEKLDYLSVRGGLSKKILENQNLQINNSKIEITPDMGWLFPSVLEHSNSLGKLYRKYIDYSKYMIFQINNISEIEAKEIGRYLLEFQEKTNIKVVLLPVIRPWEDYKYLKMINDNFLGEFLLLDNNLGILEIADIIVHSHIVLTSSLHANITALSAGIPAGIINKWQGTKLQDLYGHQFRLKMVRHSLEDIPSLLTDLLEEEKKRDILKSYSEFMQLSLNNVFDELVRKIKSKKY